MDQRTIVVRLAQGDAAALSASVTLRHGAQVDTLELSSSRRQAEWSYTVTEAHRSGVSYVVEYAWGWAREATARGEWDAEVLILPLPGEVTDGSFPFPRRS